MEDQKDLLNEISERPALTSRIKLIPVWIKIFAWLFLILGCIVPVALVLGILGYSFQLSLYGFETEEPFSIIGIALIALFALKGVVSFGILKEKSWAIKLGIFDAAIGIIACVFVMIYPFISAQEGGYLSLRLELIALIPYLAKFLKIKPGWEYNADK